MNAHVKLNIPSTLENVRLVGSVARTISTYQLVSPADSQLIETAIVESCTNVVEHAYQFEPTKNIEVLIELNPTSLIFTIIDEGRQYDPSNARPFDFDPTDIENLPEGGMGIFIFNTIMDEVHYATRMGKNHLKLVKYVQSVS
ncbi:MAG: ATP-binding protein [Candidatus Zhuqueibacterota bacterium]